MIRYALLALSLTLLVASGLWLDQQSRPAVSFPLVAQDTGVVYASGRIEGASPDIEIRPEVHGRIAEICVREGQFVEAGMVLVRLDASSAEQQVALRRAELSLAQAQLLRIKNGAHEQERLEAKAIWESKQAELKQAQLSWARVTQLRANSTVSKEELDNHRGDMDSRACQVAAAKAHWDFVNASARDDEIQSAQARCEVATAHVELAKTNLAKTVLSAPSSGQILKVANEPGELTGPDSTNPIATLVDTRRKRVRAFVEELDSGRIAVGQTARILAEGWHDMPLQGRVVELAPRMSRKQTWSDRPDERFDLKTREILIELSSTQVVPGLSVEVEILTRDQENSSGDAQKLTRSRLNRNLGLTSGRVSPSP